MDLPTTVGDVKKLTDAQVQESLNLDYKDSRSLSNSKARAEIAKDVSAFANSDGGLIVYGVEEKEHLPVRVDEGVEHGKFSREWLENVITSNIAPRIEDVQIAQIPLSDSHSIFAIKVPKSFRGPHQERLESKRYYRRFNSKSVPMEDYEIREAFNRRQIAPPLVNVDVEIKYNLVRFVVANYGNATAQNVRFAFPEGLAWHEQSKPNVILERGISNFPPSRIMRFGYNVFSELLEKEGSDAKCFDVSVVYFHPGLRQQIKETFSFDLVEFSKTVVNESDIERLTKKLVDEMKNLTNEVKNLDGKLEKISSIASATGLHMSVPTIENLRHIAGQTGETEKLYPLHRSPEVFMEVLEVPHQVAWNFVEYFDGSGEAESISQIEGATAEVLERFKRYFIWVKVQKPPLNRLFTVERSKTEPEY